MTMHPIIGITCTTSIPSCSGWGELSPTEPQDIVPRNYIQAIVEAGGAPLLIPLIDDQILLELLVSRLDGVLLSGGPDMNPVLFNDEPHQHLGLIDSAKDLLELRLIKLALEENIPLFGICRGIQVLNLVAGGTLYQDLPSQYGSSLLKHVQAASSDTLTHSVSIHQDTRLHHILQQQEILVNSHHHQAVKDVAPGFRVSAVSADGVIEGIEHTSKSFVVGVQWHPEGMYNTSARQLFRAFVEAAGK